jgi:hypothetical protein
LCIYRDINVLIEGMYNVLFIDMEDDQFVFVECTYWATVWMLVNLGEDMMI